MMRLQLIILGFGLCLLSYGCGGGVSDAPQTYPVTGTVTLDGQPLSSGSIVLDVADNTGKPAAGGIDDGQFSFESTIGSKIVRISAVEETGETDQYGEIISVSIIPEKYNVDSELKADITADSENILSFDLKSE